MAEMIIGERRSDARACGISGTNLLYYRHRIAICMEPVMDKRSIAGASTRTIEVTEKDKFLRSLKSHGQVKETTDPNAKLEPGQTHLYIKKPGETSGVLVEKRKSFF